MRASEAKVFVAFMRKSGAKSFEFDGLKVEFSPPRKRDVVSAANKALEALESDPQFQAEKAKREAEEAAKAFEELLYRSA